MSEKRLILVPPDGSAFSGMRLVHVHMRVTADPIHVEGLSVIDEHMHSLGREHEQAYLDQAREGLAGDDDLSAVLLDGPMADALAAYADSSGAMLIVMTTHGRGGLERAWLGSVADERRQEQRARKYLHRLARRLEASGLRVRTRVQTATTVAWAILDVARGEQADIVALAAHGRSGIRRLTLGSVADKVVRGSPVPVLVFRRSEAIPAKLQGHEADVDLPGDLSSTAPQALTNTASQKPS